MPGAPAVRAGVGVHAAGGALGLGGLLPPEVGPAVLLPRPRPGLVPHGLGAAAHRAGIQTHTDSQEYDLNVHVFFQIKSALVFFGKIRTLSLQVVLWNGRNISAWGPPLFLLHAVGTEFSELNCALHFFPPGKKNVRELDK